MSNVVEQNDLFCVPELLTAVEPRNLEDEEVSQHSTIKLSDKMASRSGRTTSSDDIIHNKHILTRSHGPALHLKAIPPIFLLVGSIDARPGHLPSLTHGRESNAQPQRQARSEEEAPGVETDDDVRQRREVATDPLLESVEEGDVSGRRGEYRHDVDEIHPRDGEVCVVAEMGADGSEAGELGGGGGGGGGLDGRGIILCLGGRHCEGGGDRPLMGI